MPSKQEVKDALTELGFEPIPPSIIGQALELAYRAGCEAGKLEAQEICAQTPSQRKRLYRRSVLVAQVARLLAVNRYLFSLLIDADARHGRVCSMDKAVKVFTSLPHAQVPGRPKKPISPGDGKAVHQVKRLHRQARQRKAANQDAGGLHQDSAPAD